MYDTNVKFEYESRNLNLYKTARQLGISVGASIKMTEMTSLPSLIHTSQL